MKRRRTVQSRKRRLQTSPAGNRIGTGGGRINKKENAGILEPVSHLAQLVLKGVGFCWIIIVFLLVCRQPFELGFYADDWALQAEAPAHGAPFSAARFHFLLDIDPSRPGGALTRYPLTAILGGRPAPWQAAMLLANILVALGIARTAYAITGHEPRAMARWIGLGAGLLWLLLPFSTSTQFWTVLLPIAICVAVFAWMMSSFTQRETPTIAASILWGLAYLWMCLSYEAFYGQFIPLVLICAGLAILRKSSYQCATRALISLGVAQALAVIWYFRSANVNWSQRIVERGSGSEAIQGLIHMPGRMLLSMPETNRAFSVAFLVLLASSGWILWRSRHRWTQRRIVLGSTVIGVACLAGVIGSVFTFTAGGRHIVTIGIENRSFLFVNFWIVHFAAIALVNLLRLARSYSRWIIVTSALACGLTLGVAHFARASEWRASWVEQQRILKEAPLKQLGAVSSSATVVFINHSTANGAPVFEYPWDIGHALPLTYPELRGISVTVYNPFIGVMNWDGSHLWYTGQKPLATFDNIYIWIPAERSFDRATAPLRVTQDLRVHYLR